MKENLFSSKHKAAPNCSGQIKAFMNRGLNMKIVHTLLSTGRKKADPQFFFNS